MFSNEKILQMFWFYYLMELDIKIYIPNDVIIKNGLKSIYYPLN
jgi:hypothetical protein